MGLKVVDIDDGHLYGELTQVSPTGANDVYHIRFADGKERLIPAIPQVVLEVDLDGGVMKIRPLEGSLTMRIDIATLFPEMCEAVLGESIIGRARRAGKLEIHCHNIRDYTQDKHRRVDDTPYGGGKGMLMQTEPIYNCYQAVCEMIAAKPHVIYMSPKGQPFSQQRAIELREYENIFILCGHYEEWTSGCWMRIEDEEISLGDSVLTGGELGALVVADAVGRLCPGVLSEEVCFTEESHYSGLLEYPQYTRPPVWHGMEVPAVLSKRRGHHANILKWQREQSILETAKKRPDLLWRAIEEGKLDKRSLPLPDSCWKKRMNSSRLFVGDYINCHRRRKSWTVGAMVKRRWIKNVKRMTAMLKTL